MKIEEKLTNLENDLLSALDQNDDYEVQKQFIEKAIKDIEDFYQDFSDKSEYYYARGYIKYQFPKKDETLKNEIEKELLMALKINKNHNLALFMLGTLYYDQKKYMQALYQFERIDLIYFAEIDQMWRVLRTKEFIVSCRIYLSEKIEASIHQDLESLVKDYMNVVKSNMDDPSFPFYVTDAIVWYLEQKGIINDLEKQAIGLVKSLIQISRAIETLKKEYNFLCSFEYHCSA